MCFGGFEKCFCSESSLRLEAEVQCIVIFGEIHFFFPHRKESTVSVRALFMKAKLVLVAGSWSN